MKERTMPQPPTRTIPVFEAAEVVVGSDYAAPAGRPLQARGLREQTVRIVEAGVDVLQGNMAAFVEAVGAMIAQAAETDGPYQIETLEVQCQISGTGKIGFAGTGLDIGGNSSMKIVFKRKPGG